MMVLAGFFFGTEYPAESDWLSKQFELVVD